MRTTTFEPRAPRKQWMDILRGVSILLVIINHAILFTERQSGAAPEVAVALNTIMAPVRMPLMVFLSGLLLTQALAKPWKIYVSGKVRRVLYPFIIWSVGVIIAEGLLEAMASDGGFPYARFVENLYAPVAHLWFLHYLFIYYVLALVLRKVPSLVVAAGFLAVCTVTPVAERFFLLMAFFMLGKWAAEQSATFERLIASRVVVSVCALVSLVLVILAFQGVEVRYEAISAPLAVAGIILLVRGGRLIEQQGWVRPVASVGQDSIVYYLSHWYGAMAGVALAIALNLTPWLVILCGALGGIGLAALLHRLYRRGPGWARYAFEFPLRRQHVRI